MSENKKWTDDVRERMSRYESSDVPQGLWDGIESALDSKSRTRVIPWMRIASMAAAAAVVAAAFILTAPSEEEQTAMIQAAAKKSGQTATDILADKMTANTAVADNEKAMADRGSHAVTSVKPSTVSMLQIQVSRHSEPQSDAVVGETSAADRVESVAEVAVVQEKAEPMSKEVKNTKKEGSNRLLADYSGEKPAASRKRNSGGMSLSMYAANIASSSSTVAGYRAFTSSSSVMSSPVEGGLNGSFPSLVNSYASPATKVEHHQPVSVGVGARYFINNRWAVETGLTYSMLESETGSDIGMSHIYDNQKIHYLGVPVSVGYQWINGKRLSVYTSCGVTAEFGVKGTMNTTSVLEGGDTDKTTSDISDIPVQMSVGVSAGVQYNILRNLGVYVEPGMVYYIDNGSSLETSYSDKPLNFKLKVGVRLDINRK